MVTGILFSHGSIGDAILRASAGILGSQDSLFALSNEGMALPQIRQTLQNVLDQKIGEQGAIIFTCLHGGSCWNAARLLAREDSRIRVISGLSLPMLLSFLTKREGCSLDELVDTIMEDAKRGVQQLKMRTEDACP